MSAKSVLILGGNGKISKILTPILLNKGWSVTSVIRSEDQVAGIKALAPSSASQRLKVLVHSVEDVKSESDAKSVLQESKPDYVVWSAGAGGKGPASRTFSVDRDAAIYFIKASAASPTVKRFLMVSYLGSRRGKPSWWNDESWAAMQKVNTEVLPKYYEAKIAADEVLYRESRARGRDFVGINLRPGTLSDEPAGKVELGKTGKATGNASRASVAEVAAELLALGDNAIGNCWIDMMDGQEDVAAAVSRVAKEKVDCAEEEPVFEEK
ncbi:NAD dependent epimerase/dehydratase [Pyricularia oryzae 70-15]|uniref:NAD dependent epimerase/dehydratase n=3 Tax=Pyricularia oryzae TaxID=318829 RepID=G4N7E1_PYRO7|nr:NAD dependent epimerase/dehydratase [Pyricularia oryzae 70-15]EHA50000.1 NAD dependent epimerase/dehydratase [Pyricularia oryzae 70-15]ELQ36519.1 NAD dependent epimerase/dehydratase family protein [Pyricularia oryzae Y34]KAI7916271.1 NAD dependent epimerase/dehydratase [Pyricularia oryzae]KAI7923432.1 NAD dependent epimerase/dehydratase [Pyricularia oryzae]